MTPPRLRRAAALAVVAVLAGCASFANKREYADYRAYRLEDEERPRLIAAAQYVQRHPDGTWIEVVQEERQARERDVYQEVSGVTDPAEQEKGLRFYLEAYPDGRYKDIAEQRLAAVVDVLERQRQEAEARVREQRERDAEQRERQRTWVSRATGFWTQTLLGLANWGSSIRDVARSNERFSTAFGQSPRPRCSPAECVKFYETNYTIPVPGGTALTRKMVVTLRLRFVDGKLERTEILYPNKGFSRWYEHENEDRPLVIDEDPQSREAAIAWALERIMPVVNEAAPGATALEGVALAPIDALDVDRPEEAEVIAGVNDEPEAPAEPAAPAAPAAPAQPAQPERDLEAFCAENPEELECLMRRAGGGAAPIPGEQNRPAEAPTPTPEPTEPAEPVIVNPQVLRALGTDTLRITVFAAPLEAPADAYDGLVIEHVPPPPVEEPPPAGRRRR